MRWVIILATSVVVLAGCVYPGAQGHTDVAPQREARVPNLEVRKLARQIRGAAPAFVQIQMVVADLPRGTWHDRDYELWIRNSSEVAEILDAFARSDRLPRDSDPIEAMGKDNFVEFVFFSRARNEVGRFQVPTRTLGTWGAAVRQVVVRYLPQHLEIAPDGRLEPVDKKISD